MSEQTWDKSGLKEACQRGLALGRTRQEFDIQLLLDMLLEIERLGRERDFETEERRKVQGQVDWYENHVMPDLHQGYEDARRETDEISSFPAVAKSMDFGAKTLPECVEMAIDRHYQQGRRDGAEAERKRLK